MHSLAQSIPRSPERVVSNKPGLPGRTRALRFLTIARRLANSLSNPLAVAEAVADTSLERFVAQRGLEGAAGMALFYAGVLQYDDEPQHREALHAYMKKAAHSSAPTTPGLFSGLDGLLAASTYARRVEPRYSGLASQCGAVLEGMCDHPESFQPATIMYDYDLIAGRAGSAIARAFADCGALTASACDYVVWLLGDSERWKCAHPLRPEEGRRHDLGMAHGVAGMLASLCLSAPGGRCYDSAIRIAADFLCEKRCPGKRIDWPGSIGDDTPQATRSAWCYGLPGCAAALILASQRLGDERYERLALAALHALCKAPLEEWVLQDYALCHGVSGDAVVLLRLGSCTNDSVILAKASELFDHLADAYDEEARFGYRAQIGNKSVDSGALLTGAAGIGLALLTAAGACDPSWVRYFGLP